MSQAKKRKLKEKEAPNLPVMNPRAAGIDIGATETYVAVHPDCDQGPVRSFATFTKDLHQLADGLKACKVESVAMESTGVERLAQLSVAQLYRLRKSCAYRQRRVIYQTTRPTQVAIGERRKPDPQGRPGYLRLDTVHQGDPEGVKGLYPINAVDEVTQWQVVGATAQISEVWLLPVLEAVLRNSLFAFADFIPTTAVSSSTTPWRDWVIRKHIGYGHIASAHAEAFDPFYRQHFNPYLNFHRPCGVPEVTTTAKGKQKRVYRWYATPWEILRQLPGLAAFLLPDVTVDQLAQCAQAASDTQAATEMQEAKRKLFASLHRKRSA